MSKDYSFNVMPSVSISRSRFVRRPQHKTSFNLGQIIPIFCDEVLPGDTRSIDMAALVRMSTPIAPIMDNIFIDYFAFFVPNRIVWDHWKEFMGENNTSAGIPQVEYSIPYVADDETLVSIEVGSYGDYFGLPTDVEGILHQNKISALPFRGLAKIYNRWFRDQNLIAPLAVQTGDANEVLVGDLDADGFSNFVVSKGSVLRAAKVADYFTKALPYAQKGAAVTIPLGTTAPVITSSSEISTSGLVSVKFKTGVNTSITGGTLGINASSGLATTGSTAATGASAIPSNLVADLSEATAATINQLRYAFQLQKLLERDSLFGSRYWELLAAHFGIRAPDASLQDPEYLGGWRQNINIDQVLQTTGSDTVDPSNNQLGTPGANSVTGGRNSIFTKSFTEHGYIFILAVARHESTYGQGINRMWTRQGRYDFYFPVFANLGAQEIRNKEIYAQGTSTDEGIFGYQEAWAEYRYKPSIVSGILKPSAENSLSFWTLAENFGSLPTLGKNFIEQGRNNLKRALVTGNSGPDFIADFYFKDIAVRPMPMYSIPGLIDHH